MENFNSGSMGDRFSSVGTPAGFACTLGGVRRWASARETGTWNNDKAECLLHANCRSI